MDASILNALKDLSSLMATKHLRVQRKAKQIAAVSLNQIVDHNKELVLPMLRKLTQSTTSEEEEIKLVTSVLGEQQLSSSRLRTTAYA